jgi:ERI1 exoribonuclease 3
MTSFLHHSVWHDTAIPFKEVLQEFEDWMEKHNLWSKQQGGSLNSAAFVTW